VQTSGAEAHVSSTAAVRWALPCLRFMDGLLRRTRPVLLAAAILLVAASSRAAGLDDLKTAGEYLNPEPASDAELPFRFKGRPFRVHFAFQAGNAATVRTNVISALAEKNLLDQVLLSWPGGEAAHTPGPQYPVSEKHGSKKSRKRNGKGKAKGNNGGSEAAVPAIKTEVKSASGLACRCLWRNA
jgi:hypothetical protein